MRSAAPHVAVIGAGVAGLSAAYHLAEAGCAVTVIEQGEIAGGSSGLSAGVYSEATYVDALQLALRSHSIAALRELERTDGLDLRPIGFLRLARDEQTLAAYADGLALQRAFGIEDGEVIDRARLQQLVPAMDCEDYVGALWGPRDGYLDGHQLCMVYAERAAARGMELRLRTAVTGAGRGAHARHRLEVSRGEAVECDVVVNAAGGWADRVGDLLGTPIGMIPQRHQICIVHTAEPFGYTVPEVMDYVPGTGELGLWFRQEREDQLLAGLHSNDLVGEGDREDPDDYFRGVSADYVEALAETLLHRLPGFEMSLQPGWAGLYPFCRDGQFAIGPAVEDETVIHACGLGGIGVNTSPAVGQLVADWIVRGAPSIAGTEALTPARFGTTGAQSASGPLPTGM